jgi:hypothetical protein
MSPKEKALKAIQDYRDAVAAGDDAKAEQAIADFEEVIIDVDDPPQEDLYNAYAAAVAGALDDQLVEFGKLAKEIAGNGDAFKLGEKMANEGRNDLFFPYIAGEFSEIAANFKKLVELAEEVVSQVDDLPAEIRSQSVEGLVNEGQEALQAIEELIGQLESIKDELENRE